ncbi:hypothetical protein SODALDRAFT_328423 [Sodiomyces alkalinus F11]|uniref:Uncharacterized protein n=1 Tax=Sodiomyces alkalinus (strain CBS 110278 / VKM F-3762 / F11) TaxID=1314773 RepID=A0A3N2PNG7_SODAK|nr:hypothetical protein SODALDRAFT_328423 [Sodiomyces alkalinus F11]ROT36042.1 hypothetical protein SODALDRAFT_328423 [Sodiomyces alkalinus F11]
MASATFYRPSAPPSYSPFPASTTTATATATATTSTSKQSAAHLLIAAQRRKRAMSITQTYYLAHKARAKLAYEASRADHDLRLLVGHANLLDSLMFELADAEREQESWFNQSVRGAIRHEEPQPVPVASPALAPTPAPTPIPTPVDKKDRHVQWADAAPEPQQLWHTEHIDVDSDDDSDLYDSDYDSDDDMEMVETVTVARPVALRPVTPTTTLTTSLATSLTTTLTTKSGATPPTTQSSSRPLLAVEEDEDEDKDEDEDMETDDLEDDYAQLELVRTVSHPHSPPELDADLSESSDEDSSMPPSPPNVSFAFPAKDAKGEMHHARSEQEEQDEEDRSSLYSEGFYIPRRRNPPLVSAISVY